MSRTVFGRSPTSTNGAAAGQHSVFGCTKNRQGQRPGQPLDWGYRPVDRPMANFLGRRLERDDLVQGFGNSGRVPEADTKFWRTRVSGVKTFSWEN